MARLQEEGVIARFVTHIDVSLLGFTRAAVFISIRRHREAEFKEFVKKSRFTSWSGEFSGVWNIGTDISGATPRELDARFLELYTKFSADIIDHRMHVYRSTRFFPEKYLAGKRAPLRRPGEERVPDDIDKRILKRLAQHSREEIVTLAKDVSLSAPAVAQRIKRLEGAGVIVQYSLQLDVSKLGIYTYSVFVTNRKAEQRERLAQFLAEHPAVVFIAQYIGDPYIEFGVATRSPYELRGILQEIEGAYPDNRVVEAFLVQREFLSVGPPECVFDSKGREM